MFCKIALKYLVDFFSRRCVVMEAKEAEDKYIAYVHSQSHIKLIKTISSKELDSRRHRVARKFNSIYFNKGSSESAYLSAGSAIEVIILKLSFYFLSFLCVYILFVLILSVYSVSPIT